MPLQESKFKSVKHKSHRSPNKRQFLRKGLKLKGIINQLEPSRTISNTQDLRKRVSVLVRNNAIQS
jgi:hypothetical protein